jgi:uncharacterized protein (DUF305 family)
MADAMNVMHKGMHSAPYTGKPDRDFVTMMIPHHQGAIDMAKALLLYGKDPRYGGWRKRSSQINNRKLS